MECVTRFRNAFGLRLGCVALAGLCAPALPAVEYVRDVRPILESRCFECHGPTRQKNGLRLDRKTEMFRGGDSAQPAVVPGKSAESPLIQRITSVAPETMMPPQGGRLTDAQIAVLKNWVEQGAAMPDDSATEPKHWAYVPPSPPSVPRVKHADWPRQGLDYFVLARLENEGLAPAPAAERATWLRRASLDLIGLPPTWEELEAFVADTGPRAWERAVDRLLASPHYGERWARPWLDLARYADTQGYEKDNRRSMWPYRDWVIRALNADLPFDEFTIEQIAGDMLPHATQDQKAATGFHRNTMTNTEGGTDNEEFRYEAIVDRVNTTMAAWMGTTMACAQCHNHKYDPFTSKEYFQLFAFLNNTADADYDDEQPTLKVFGPGQEAQLARLRTNAAQAEAAFNRAASTPEARQAFQKWERETIAGLTDWEVITPAAFASAGGASFSVTESKSLRVEGANPSNDTYTVIAHLPPGRVTGFRLEVLETGEQKALGRHEQGFFVLQQFSASLAGAPLVFSGAVADYSQKDYPVTNLLAGVGNGWAVDAADPKMRVRRSAYFSLAQPLEVAAATPVVFTLRHSSRHPGANLARFRLYRTANERVGPLSPVPDEVRAILLVSAEQRDERQHSRLTEYWQSIAPELRDTREPMLAARKAEKEFYDRIPVTSVMVELPPDKSRKTHRHARGSYLSPAEEVTAGTPAVLHPFRSEWPRNRLGLAYWLVDTNNPLTARVIMNRIWEQYFGRGIVDTLEEFGKQGEPPSHPELLDWLAVEFMRSGWSLKAMHRVIVTSATYRQSARVSPELYARDPYNRLLARGPRVRLEAELVRDQALAVSGLLSHKLYGPSVMPPQPEGLWQIVYSGDRWETSPGEDKYRRGLYTFWRRSIPHPMLTTFDAPTREFCVLKRSRSNTPLQALNTLNDPAFIECAQALARRLAVLPTADPREKIAHGLRLCLLRPAKNEELDRLARLFTAELDRYRANAPAAEKMAAGELGPIPSGLDAAELAAWTVVANVLLNLDEFITKG